MQQFSGLAAAKLVAGPPLAPLPDQSLLLTRDGDEIRRILTGAATTPLGRLDPADGGARNCEIGHSAPAADPTGHADVVYDLGSADEAKDGRCQDALLRQAIDPATLQGAGPPVALEVPASLGGAAALDMDPDPVFASRAILDVVPGPDGRPWVLHALQIADPIDRRRRLTPSDPRFLGHTELALWDADGRFRRIPRCTPAGDRVPDRVSTFDPAAPVVKAFPDGDVVVAHVTSSHRLQLESCAYLRKLEAYQRSPKGRRPPPVREFKRCRYQLFAPAAIVVGRLHAGRWPFRELPGPAYPRQGRDAGGTPDPGRQREGSRRRRPERRAGEHGCAVGPRQPAEDQGAGLPPAGRVLTWRRRSLAVAVAVLLPANLAPVASPVDAPLGTFDASTPPLRNITGVATSGSSVFVADAGVGVVRFDYAGHRVAAFAPAAAKVPVGLAAGTDGDVYVVQDGAVQRFRDNGTIAVDAKGDVFVYDQDAFTIVSFDDLGRFRFAANAPSSVTGLAVNADGSRFYVTTGSSSRPVSTYDAAGAPHGHRRPGGEHHVRDRHRREARRHARRRQHGPADRAPAHDAGRGAPGHHRARRATRQARRELPRGRVRPAQGPDVRITYMEVTQGIQPLGCPGCAAGRNLDYRKDVFDPVAQRGDVWLVTNHRTIVRVYADLNGTGAAIGDVPMVLTTTLANGGSTYGPISPVQQPGAVVSGPGVVTDAQRLSPTGAYTFEIPDQIVTAALRRGPLVLRAQIAPAGVPGSPPQCPVCTNDDRFTLTNIPVREGPRMTVFPVALGRPRAPGGRTPSGPAPSQPSG